jgi:predicted Ser/Thr protein kinase
MLSTSESFARTIADLDFEGGELLGRSNQGEVRRFRIHGQELAIKQPKGRGLAWTLRAATLRHEYRAYQRLAGLAGLPVCHGLFPGERLVLQFVEGRSLRDAEIAREDRYFITLLDLIRAIHGRGVAHGDLKRKANLLVTVEGDPIILDFGTATLLKPGQGPVNHRLFRLIRQTDLNAWVKLKYGGYEGLSEADQALLRRTGIERWLSRLRRR